MGRIAENLFKVKERIELSALRAGRDPKEIRLVAVSKGQPIERIMEGIEAGVEILGENFVQEARWKIEAINANPDLRRDWHMVGHLQSNKAKRAVELFEMIHSVDSLRLAEEIDRQAERRGKVMPVLIEVNLSGEEGKFGVRRDEALNLIRRALEFKNIDVLGLMTMPPLFEEPELSRPYFVALRSLRDELREKLPHLELKELSMGMSADFEVAIEEGATMVRIGTAIFGPRG